MKVIVGLGNPGAKYSWTRHNLGFMLIDALTDKDSFQKKHKSHIQKTEWEGGSVLLAKPQTFMNLSGQAVKSLLYFYKIPLEGLLVLQDDKDLAFGQMKLQKSRGDGGHNGIKNIHQELGTKDYTRLRMGVGLCRKEQEEEPFPQQNKNTVDYVLSPFNPEEKDKLPLFLEKGAKAVFSFVREGYPATANKFNS